MEGGQFLSFFSVSGGLERGRGEDRKGRSYVCVAGCLRAGTNACGIEAKREEDGMVGFVGLRAK